MNRFLTLFLLINSCTIPVFAFEDCVITSDTKITKIEVQDKNIVEISPLVTVMNERNTILVHPLKEGETTFKLFKNNNEKVVFNIKINNNQTIIEDKDGYEAFVLDNPPEMFDIDLPPNTKTNKNYQIDVIKGEEWTN